MARSKLPPHLTELARMVLDAKNWQDKIDLLLVLADYVEETGYHATAPSFYRDYPHTDMIPTGRFHWTPVRVSTLDVGGNATDGWEVDDSTFVISIPIRVQLVLTNVLAFREGEIHAQQTHSRNPIWPSVSILVEDRQVLRALKEEWFERPAPRMYIDWIGEREGQVFRSHDNRPLVDFKVTLPKTTGGLRSELPSS